MVRGIYTAASGMLVESLRNDTIANNLANANTTAFKKDVAVSKDFAGLLISRINDAAGGQNIGTMGAGAVIRDIVTEHSGAAIHSTDNPLDVAIEGKGFLAVQTPAGIRFTRNGELTKNASGELVTSEGYQVLSQNGGSVMVNGKALNITEDGRVFIDAVETDRLQFVEFDEKQLAKEGNSLYAANGQEQGNAATGRLRQRFLEGSNVNIVTEMVNMIAGYRAYEMNGKAVQACDQMLEKAVTEVGRVV